jgi:hypothetical protein
MRVVLVLLPVCECRLRSNTGILISHSLNIVLPYRRPGRTEPESQYPGGSLLCSNEEISLRPAAALLCTASCLGARRRCPKAA